MGDEDFWHKPARPKREIVAEHTARLTFTPATEAPPAPQPVLSLYMTDEQRLAEHDRQQGLDGQIDLSEQRKRALGIHVPRGTRHSAGDDSEARDD